jgi:hypothetical protein
MTRRDTARLAAMSDPVRPGAKPGTLAGCWPIPLRLAPFINAVLLGNAEEGGRA